MTMNVDSMARHDMRSFSRFLYQRAYCMMKPGQMKKAASCTKNS